MLHNKTKLAVIVSGALALTGCSTFNSIFGFRSDGMPEQGVRLSDEAESAISLAVKEGREHLHKGETGLAIESYQRALSMDGTSPEALNGMGVAYARLGRYEVAYRLFSEAAILNPADERYAANLSRLTRSPAFAMRHDGDIAEAATNAVARNERDALKPVASAEPRPGQLTRVSSNEVRIHTIGPNAAPLASASSQETSFKPIVRIEFAKTASDSESSSGKVVVSNPHVGKTAAVDARFKPLVRVNFQKTGADGQDD